MYFFSASNIPRPPKDASTALQPLAKKPSRALVARDFARVSEFYHTVDKESLPSEVEFVQRMEQSIRIKEKFKLFKHICTGSFVDVVAEVVKAPYDLGDRFTLWISDYTENSQFYNFALKGLSADPYNYTIGTDDGEWSGPFGKHSLQVTCWGPHAQAIRDQNITAGSFVSIRNMQIKYGRNASNAEGYLREDGDKIGIALLDHLEDGEAMDPRLKETIRRRRDYEKERKKQLKSISDAAKAGQKRRAALDEDDNDAKPRKPNAKVRRSEKRQAARNNTSSDNKTDNVEPPTQELETPIVAGLKLNPTSQSLHSFKFSKQPLTRLSPVKCENDKQPVSSVAELLQQISFETIVGKDAVSLPLPFINANYRASVRVKDYLPHKLEDFACAKISKGMYDALSDNEEEEEEEDARETMDQYVTAEKVVGWEWHFYLQLEDATGDEKNSVWVTVDNHAAQCLLNLNAGDLHQSRNLVAQLRERLFHLWGDLEEHKSKRVLRRERAEREARANRPPMDSESDDGDAGTSAAPANRPFACCIRQYGVMMDEDDESKADAGEGRRWQRMYGLFGTQISGV